MNDPCSQLPASGSAIRGLRFLLSTEPRATHFTLSRDDVAALLDEIEEGHPEDCEYCHESHQRRLAAEAEAQKLRDQLTTALGRALV